MCTEAKRIHTSYLGTSIELGYTVRPGDRGTVLFLHGLGASKDDFHGALENKDLNDYVLVMFDFPGHGKSPYVTNFTMDNLGKSGCGIRSWDDSGYSVPIGDCSHQFPTYEFIYHIYHKRLEKEPEITINQEEHKKYIWRTLIEALSEPLIQEEDSCIKLFYNV